MSGTRPAAGLAVADPARARRLVFVCLGNINRSAFGAAVARDLGLPAVSIGLSTTRGAPATPEATRQARCQRIDLSAHQATPREDYVHEAGDVLLVMEVRHAHRLLEHGIPASAIAFLGLWGAPSRVHLHDPHTLSAEYFASCFALIESAVRRIAAARQGGGA
jgi:protein-tyrosine phosphatase